MSTICFDLQRIDTDSMAIRHVKFGTSEYNCHRALHYDGSLKGNKKSPWLSDGKFRYIWVIVARPPQHWENGEEIIFVSNDKIWTNRVYRESGLKGYGYARILKIPFDRIIQKKIGDEMFNAYKENSLGDRFILNILEGTYIF